MPQPPDFADFVRGRSGTMLRAAWMLTGGDWALAEDLVQTALGEVWRRWGHLPARACGAGDRAVARPGDQAPPPARYSPSRSRLPPGPARQRVPRPGRMP